MRADRKDGRQIVPGDTLHFFTGMRTKGCRKLGQAVCRTVDRVVIVPAGHDIPGMPTVYRAPDVMFPSGITAPFLTPTLPLGVPVILSERECDELARRDGFVCAADLSRFFWVPAGVFKGSLITW
ncbi:hypothetical protein DB346_02945 [Verrucomicrobia bacterium LW23]|nr:hypothetical protein DB346_03710 [Verrucomicrobia bacterium LW23]PTY04406.1 hypothetical protein DB346_02945 [Verrucomicrobia bacterium LW23]